MGYYSVLLGTDRAKPTTARLIFFSRAFAPLHITSHKVTQTQKGSL